MKQLTAVASAENCRTTCSTKISTWFKNNVKTKRHQTSDLGIAGSSPVMVGRAPKFLGALKVVPKLVASDQKIGRSWMLVKFLNFDLCTSSLCNEIIISSYTWKVEWLDLRGSNPVTTLSMHSNMESKQWYMKLSTIKNDTTNTKANKPNVRMGSIFLLTLSSTISAYLYI